MQRSGGAREKRGNGEKPERQNNIITYYSERNILYVKRVSF
jgi:hypothetical protein